MVDLAIWVVAECHAKVYIGETLVVEMTHDSTVKLILILTLIHAPRDTLTPISIHPHLTVEICRSLDSVRPSVCSNCSAINICTVIILGT